MSDLEKFRTKINELDYELVAILARRLGVCREVAIYKLSNSVPVMQPGRVWEVKRRNSEAGKGLGLNPEFVMALYDLVIKEACRIEEAIIRQSAEYRLSDENEVKNTSDKK